MALSDRVVIAITRRRRNQPLLGRQTAQVGLWNDVAIDLAIDGVELVQSFDRHRDGALTEVDLLHLTIALIAQAENRVRHRGKRWLLKGNPVELKLQRPRIAEKCRF